MLALLLQLTALLIVGYRDGMVVLGDGSGKIVLPEIGLLFPKTGRLTVIPHIHDTVLVGVYTENEHHLQLIETTIE